MDVLKYCFSCNFTHKDFEKHKEYQRGREIHWDTYKPIIYKDRLLGKWVIECQNCGMEVIFSETEDACIELWNNIYRRDTMKAKIIELMKKYRAESERHWTPITRV